MPSFNCGIKLSFRGSNLAAHIRWFEYLAGDDYLKRTITEWQMPAHLSRVKKLAQEIVQSEIYDAYAPKKYKRTFRLRKSIRARVLGVEEAGEIGLYFDPGVATAKEEVEGLDRNKLNYAAFFDRPEFKSFIKGTTDTDVIRYRPFFDVLATEMHEREEKEALRVLLHAARYRKPKAIA